MPTPSTNPFDAPDTLPQAVSLAWRQYALTASGLFVGLLVCDGLLGVGVFWAGFVSAGGRVVLLMNGLGSLAFGVVQLATGRETSGREWLATGLVFSAVGLASLPSMLVLSWFVD